MKNMRKHNFKIEARGIEARGGTVSASTTGRMREGLFTERILLQLIAEILRNVLGTMNAILIELSYGCLLA